MVFPIIRLRIWEPEVYAGKGRNAGRGKDCVDFVSSSVSSVFFAGEYAIRFFMNEPTAEAVHTGVTYLRILSPFYFVISVNWCWMEF